MTEQTLIDAMYAQGRTDALDLQNRAPDMDGTGLIGEEEKIPDWNAKKDYTSWATGSPVKDEGQVWILLIPHNAAEYTGRPSENRALWGLAHTTDPAKAKPWVASLGTSGLYMVGECCTYPNPFDGLLHIHRNRYNKNDYPPYTLNAEDRWEDLGPA